MKGDGLNVSVIIPAYNEAENVGEATEALLARLPGWLDDYEVIVVDDGSSDTTGTVIRRLAGEYPQLIPVHHGKNRGKGAALRSGFSVARMDWVFFTDADQQIDIAELETFLSFAKEYDLVIGFRSDRRADPYFRRLFSKIYTAIIAVTLGVRVRDVNCPFKLIKKPVISAMELQSNGFFIDTEMLCQARLLGFRIKELEVPCRQRLKGESTVRFRHVVETVRELRSFMTKEWHRRN